MSYTLTCSSKSPQRRKLANEYGCHNARRKENKSKGIQLSTTCHSRLCAATSAALSYASKKEVLIFTLGSREIIWTQWIGKHMKILPNTSTRH